MKFNGQIIWKVLSYTGLYLTRFAPDLVQCWKRYGLNGSFLRLSMERRLRPILGEIFQLVLMF